MHEIGPGPAPEILNAVFKAIDDVNELLDSENRVTKSLDTALVGRDAVLDSMGFINLPPAVQERIEEALGTSICLADFDGGDGVHAFRTVGTLADHVSRIVAPMQKSERRPS